jgi:MerR family transcriptional regulator, Zn(II)-responsive regulator of zntA
MTDKLLTIGELAMRAGVTPDTLRYYERLGLVPPAPRTRAGYRVYEPVMVERLAFIDKAKALGLTLEEVREVLRVAADGTPPCEHVRAALSRRLREVEARITELEGLRRTLARALQRSRELPVAASCVCEIIESQEVLRPDAARPKSAGRGRRASTTNKKEAL